MLSVCVWCLGGKSKKNNINILCVIELQALKYYSFVCFWNELDGSNGS